MMVYVDLVLQNGGIVVIECPDKYADELFDALDNARKKNDWWSPIMFEGCSATFMGMTLDRVDMGKVIGTL